VESLASSIKKKNPKVVIHCDAVQGFGRTDFPVGGGSVDLVSISAHKVTGPKGIGACVVLNPELLQKKRLRPLIWGGSQENGLRSGTHSAGLIGAFHVAAERTLKNRTQYEKHMNALKSELMKEFQARKLFDEVKLNSPQ